MGLSILADALNKGGEVIWDPPEKPRLRVPKYLEGRIRQDIKTVRKVLERAVIFKKQLKV